MTKKEYKNIKNIIKILTRLDKKSLLLIDSGAKLLEARQEMESQGKKERGIEMKETKGRTP